MGKELYFHYEDCKESLQDIFFVLENLEGPDNHNFPQYSKPANGNTKIVQKINLPQAATSET